MGTQFDFKKEIEKAKKQLIALSKDAAKIAQEGQKELVKLSNTTKLHYESTAAALHKEKLYYLIGKEYVKLKDSSKGSAVLKKLVDELKQVDKEQRAVRSKLKTKSKLKPKTTKKSAKAK